MNLSFLACEEEKLTRVVPLSTKAPQQKGINRDTGSSVSCNIVKRSLLLATRKAPHATKEVNTFVEAILVPNLAYIHSS